MYKPKTFEQRLCFTAQVIIYLYVFVSSCWLNAVYVDSMLLYILVCMIFVLSCLSNAEESKFHTEKGQKEVIISTLGSLGEETEAGDKVFYDSDGNKLTISIDSEGVHYTFKRKKKRD